MSALAGEILAVMARDLRISLEDRQVEVSSDERLMMAIAISHRIRDTALGDRARRIACITAGAMARVACY